MNKILLGLSGGTDSAVAAAILKEKGFEVIGCFLMMTENSHESSPDALAALSVAEHLGISLVMRDVGDIFKEKVSDYFIREYLSGRTPNPCVMCNPNVKIHSLLNTADEMGIEMIATGHYALTGYSEKYGGTVLKASPSKKDQSYFLGMLTPKQTERLVFPLGEFNSKQEIREYAKRLSLPNAEKPDSLEICFIPDNDYGKYICEKGNYTPCEGNFLDNEGRIIGRHSGIINYTVGQRKGLGAFGEPRYVKHINAGDNTVTLCKKDERYEMSLEAESLSYAVRVHPEKSFIGRVKIRSTAKAQEGVITVTGDTFRVDFKEAVLAPTPGQTAVIYDSDDTVIGAGVIIR